jgi:hypothetical protein
LGRNVRNVKRLKYWGKITIAAYVLIKMEFAKCVALKFRTLNFIANLMSEKI